MGSTEATYWQTLQGTIDATLDTMISGPTGFTSGDLLDVVAKALLERERNLSAQLLLYAGGHDSAADLEVYLTQIGMALPEDT